MTNIRQLIRDLNESPIRGEPEARLVNAMIMQAVKDAYGTDPEIAKEALEFLKSKQLKNLVSLVL